MLALIGLRASTQLLQRNRALVLANTAHFEAFCKRHSQVFGFTAPKTGSIAFARLLTGEPVEIFCKRLVAESGERPSAAAMRLSCMPPAARQTFCTCPRMSGLHVPWLSYCALQASCCCRPLSMIIQRLPGAAASGWGLAGRTCQSACKCWRNSWSTMLSVARSVDTWQAVRHSSCKCASRQHVSRSKCNA